MSFNHLSGKIMASGLCLLLSLVQGCGRPSIDPAELRNNEIALVQATVSDPHRAEQLLSLLVERDRLIADSIALTYRYRSELKAMNADYAADRALAVEMLDYYNRDRAQIQRRFLLLVAAMKQNTSAPEWRIIAQFQLANFRHHEQLIKPIGGNS